MIRYFKIWVILLGLILAVLVILFAVSLYVGSCSYQNNCADGGRARLAHTPIPTLIPTALEVIITATPVPSSSENCSVTAETLLSAWIKAGFPEKKPFQFTDSNNIACEASFDDVQPLFIQSNLWYSGALACTSCHNADLSAAASAFLDLSSYAGVVAGSQRKAGSATGVDILGGGDWQKSKLNQVIFMLHQMPYGAPANAVPEAGPTILAGLPLSVVNATPTETPSAPEIARPNNPGGAGDAAKLTGDPVAGKKIFETNCQLCHGSEGKGEVLNPGSNDGTVPALNPIDTTLASTDYATFAYNLDLFLENGSPPAGINPSLNMPPWGIQKGLSQQQIADAIAYIISLNK